MSGNPISIAALYAQEQLRLQRHLVRRGLSAPAAADAVQEAFLRLLRAPSADIRDIRGYLHRTAETVAIDAWRQQGRAAAVIDPASTADDDVPDLSPAADAALIAREERAALQAAIRDLPERCREVLLLHKFEGLSYLEIAQRLGIARNTVMVHLANAMSGLRKRLRENNPPQA
jgi:RNA polymerase sigma-70 factor (ECF subfamily)